MRVGRGALAIGLVLGGVAWASPASAQRLARLDPVRVHNSVGPLNTPSAPAPRAPFRWRHRYDCPCYPITLFIVDGVSLYPEEFAVSGVTTADIEAMWIALKPGPRGDAVAVIRTRRR